MKPASERDTLKIISVLMWVAILTAWISGFMVWQIGDNSEPNSSVAPLAYGLLAAACGIFANRMLNTLMRAKEE